MLFKKTLSVHPKLVAVVEALLGAAWLAWFFYLPSFTWLGIWAGARVAIWVGESAVAYYPPTVSRGRHLLSLVFWLVGITLFLLLSDWPLSRYVLGGIFVAGPAVSWWLLPSAAAPLSFVSKPERRWRLIMAVVGVAGVWSGWLAGSMLQLVPLSWWWLGWLSVSLLVVGVTAWWWREYRVALARRGYWWLAGLLLLYLELSAAVWWWPLGYLAGGLLLTWVWYISWLLVRFHLTVEGIVWGKQRWFIIVNAVLLALYLGLAVRWR